MEEKCTNTAQFKYTLEKRGTALATAQEECVVFQQRAMTELEARAKAQTALQEWQEWYNAKQIDLGAEYGGEEEADEDGAG